MGLFDFLKRKKSLPKNDDGPSPDYAFAHVALRQIALASPLDFLGVIASPDATDFLDSILKQVAEHCGRPASFSAKALKIHKARVASFPCAVIEFPAPKEVAEAHMVALLVPIEMGAEFPDDPSTIVGRFFTLEKGFTFKASESRTVLAEWDATSHSNYGDGPAPKVRDFVDALEKLVGNQ